MATKTLLTLEQFERLPDDDVRHELDEGELLTLSPALRRHGRLQVTISSLLDAFVRANSLGEIVVEVGFVLSRHPATVRAPDIAFIRSGRPPTATRFEDGPPDLAVEIVSPSDTASDMIRKVNQYLRAGARAVWVVYPEVKQVHVFEPAGAIRVLEADQILSAPGLLPGFSVPVRVLFE